MAVNMVNGENKYEQYMTPGIVANFMVSLSDLNINSGILEPCSGEGIFLTVFKKMDSKMLLHMKLIKH